jgi:hypothetical protein
LIELLDVVTDGVNAFRSPNRLAGVDGTSFCVPMGALTSDYRDREMLNRNSIPLRHGPYRIR